MATLRCKLTERDRQLATQTLPFMDTLRQNSLSQIELEELRNYVSVDRDQQQRLGGSSAVNLAALTSGASPQSADTAQTSAGKQAMETFTPSSSASSSRPAKHEKRQTPHMNQLGADLPRSRLPRSKSLKRSSGAKSTSSKGGQAAQPADSASSSVSMGSAYAGLPTGRVGSEVGQRGSGAVHPRAAALEPMPGPAGPASTISTLSVRDDSWPSHVPKPSRSEQKAGKVGHCIITSS